MTPSFFERIFSIGTGPWLTVQEQRYVRFLNGSFAAAAVFGVVIGGAALLLLDTRQADWGPFVGFFLGVLVLGLQHRRRYTAALNVAHLGSMAFVVAATLATPEAYGLRIYLLVLAMGVFMIPRPRREQDLFFTIGVVLYAGLDWWITRSFYSLVHIVVASLILYAVSNVFRSEQEKAEAAVAERDRSISAQNERLVALNEALHESLRLSEEQARRLDELNTAKDRVVSVLSHDLRGPLHVLDGVLEAYEEGHFSPEDLSELMADTRRSLSTTQAQLEDVLAWARLLLGGANPDAQTDLSDAVRRSAVYAADRAAAKGVRVKAVCVPKLLVRAEAASVSLLLRNLVANALKFTPEGGQITVSAEIAGEGAVLRVADTGVGIAPERLDELNAGGRTQQTTLGTHGEKGSGLGLTLCHEVAAHLGGRLRATSVLGEGSTFSVVFPDARVLGGVAEAALSPASA